MKLLFIGEAVTLAHVVRPLALAGSLSPFDYDITFACDPRRRGLVDATMLAYRPLESIPSETFLERVAGARMLYTARELAEYVRADLDLLAETDPDVVVGDFRLSLGISAELHGVPYFCLGNLHWSHSLNLPCPVPEHPLVRILGVEGMRRFLRYSLPMYFNRQVKAFNRLRRSVGLAGLETDGKPVPFTYGSRTLYLDVPELYGAGELSDTEHCIGPVHWSPCMDLPEWWDGVGRDRPMVFVSPGSSGSPRAARTVIDALAGFDVDLVVATAGRMDASALPAGVRSADFIPGRAAAERASLIVCNGGSGMVYQALAAATPVLGIPSNIDQYYVMEAVERIGAGALVRAGRVTRDRVAIAAAELLTNPARARAAGEMRDAIRRYDPAERFVKVLGSILPDTGYSSSRARYIAQR